MTWLSWAEGLTCRAGAAVEGAQSVEALHRRVCGAGFVREAALINISCARWCSGWRHPASITDTLIFGLKRDIKKDECCSKAVWLYLLRRTQKENVHTALSTIILSSTIVLNIDNKKSFLIRKSEGSCGTEDLSNDDKIQQCVIRINYILEYIKFENSYFKL